MGMTLPVSVCSLASWTQSMTKALTEWGQTVCRDPLNLSRCRKQQSIVSGCIPFS